MITFATMKEQDSNSPIIHLQQQQLLLRMEYEYEKEEFKRQTENMGVARKVKRGLCWYPATPGRSYYNSLNQLVIEITHTENTDIEHNFEFGRPVCFFRQSADGKITYMNFTATVSYADETRMVAIMPGAGAVMEVQETDNLGVQLYFDETSYRTMFEALEDTLRSKGNRLAELRDILLGTSKAGFRELYPVRFPWLNSTQETAVNKVLCARDVAIVHGPPGTGKTSIARSIARALDKKYVRISLGGVRDEAEIRGHRRTYVGAMPGRIVNGLRMAGVKNPLMLLDEIDKMSSDYKGDTASAMLEVLDSEQNHKFRDHYVELPVDLSEVLFIASANSMQDIPGPLLDRMEIIEVSSYTENEKFHIAKDHLLAKQFEKNGVADGKLKITDKALRMVISSYTREAGVRSLERQIGEICRKAARRIYEGDEKMIRVTGTNLEDFLGKPKYRPEKKNKKNEVGIVRGLAWTSVGGVTLEIEVNLMPGKGSVVLTGKLGDVMKESAQTGISYIRSISEDYHIDPEFFQKHDIHIHVPEGAVPKDGPSAGITMATAILSAVTGKPVRADVAMTGEITLRGRVLPIGGLKEKLLAAKNAGMKTVCIPKENEQDLAEISEEIVGDMEIIPVEHMDQVIKAAFV